MGLHEVVGYGDTKEQATLALFASLGRGRTIGEVKVSSCKQGYMAVIRRDLDKEVTDANQE